jgi:enamine deaminase RidA (YjgF/YER057c/UK114 family)
VDRSANPFQPFETVSVVSLGAVLDSATTVDQPPSRPRWIVWLAGQVGAADTSGNSLAGDFDGQVREVFARLDQTLEEAGGSLADMVTMTVFLTDARYGDRFTELRKEIFRDNFPASALITVTGLARPEMLVEVQGIAVIG